MSEPIGNIVPIPPSGQTMAIPPKSYPARLIDVLDRALHDPSIPMERIERTIALIKEAFADEAQRAYSEDYASLQKVLPTFEERGQISIGKGAKVQTYALWSDINKILRPLLSQFGFGLSFRIATPNEKSISVVGILSHKGGHTETSERMILPMDLSGSKNAVQSYGSSVSYGKRYVASAMLNLTSSAEVDDDALAAGGASSLSEDQVAEVQALIVESGADIKAFLMHMGLPEGSKVEDLRAAQFEDAIAALEHKKKVVAGKKTKAAPNGS